MEAFGRLSPALQYQIVNGLGWTGLRPVQEQSTHAILDGTNCVIVAPTAGGKTEAALLPLLTRMNAEDLEPVSVLYIAPIRALLNNQESRLRALTMSGNARVSKFQPCLPALVEQELVARELMNVNDANEVLSICTRVRSRSDIAPTRDQ